MNSRINPFSRVFKVIGTSFIITRKTTVVRLLRRKVGIESTSMRYPSECRNCFT